MRGSSTSSTSRQDPSAPGSKADRGRGRTPRRTSSGATATSKQPAELSAIRRAQRSTSKVAGCTATARSSASRLSRLTSLSASWKLMQRWTRRTSSKAASTARCAAAALAGGAVISTKVPRSGRHRRTSALEDERIEAQDSPDALRDVAAGERGAADVLDVGVELERRAVGLADELLAPLRVANLVSV